jgi:two-component system chemotaxis response regulator CheY
LSRPFILTSDCSLSILSDTRVLGEPMDNAPLRRLVVADGNVETRQTLALTLAETEFDVLEAATGQSALEIVHAQHIDVLVLDLWMPDMDGIELIRAVRRRLPACKVFVVTEGGPGLSIASAAALARVWGAQRTYIRPFSVEDLLADIRLPAVNTGIGQG